MGPLASVEHEHHDGVTIARVHGEIDVSNGEQVQAQILDGVTLGTRRMILDLSGIEYFDSVGVRLVFELQQRFAGQHIAFALVREPQSYVRKVLELCGAEQVLEVFDDVDSATSGVR